MVQNSQSDMFACEEEYTSFQRHNSAPLILDESSTDSFDEILFSSPFSRCIATTRRLELYDTSEESPSKRIRLSLDEDDNVYNNTEEVRVEEKCPIELEIPTDIFDSECDNVEATHEQSLPTVSGYHSDLKYITTQTMEDLLNSDKEFVVVDCRYPYEYNGGHIENAKNLYRKEMIQEEFIDNKLNDTETDVTRSKIMIFHCEFSSERGPKMCRFLREQDRKTHSDCYPKLFYPELYVLKGGYKEYFEQQGTEHCEPKTYRPMLHKQYNHELKHYRKETKTWGRSKSWHGRERSRKSCEGRLLKFADV